MKSKLFFQYTVEFHQNDCEEVLYVLENVKQLRKPTKLAVRFSKHAKFFVKYAPVYRHYRGNKMFPFANSPRI